MDRPARAIASSDASSCDFPAYNADMEELAVTNAEGSEQAPVAQTNRGWFQAGDQRINREGRPRGSKAPTENLVVDRAARTDRLMTLFVPERDLALRLSKPQGPWLVNLPTDFQIVACRLDAARNCLVVTIRSPEFPRVAKGAAIPEFEPKYNGIMWRTKR